MLMKYRKKEADKSILRLTVTALFIAITAALSSFAVPLPTGGHLYLTDVAICTAALLLDPLLACLAGGLGAFLGDLFFYPQAMLVSLVTHGLQALTVSFLARKTLRSHPYLAAVLGMICGVCVMTAGYTMGTAFIYGTPASALIKIPGQLLQASVGAVFGYTVVHPLGVGKMFSRLGLDRKAGRSADHGTDKCK